jgi:hypothetical protein
MRAARDSAAKLKPKHPHNPYLGLMLSRLNEYKEACEFK